MRGTHFSGTAAAPASYDHVLSVVDDRAQAAAALDLAANLMTPGRGRVRAVHLRTWHPDPDAAPKHHGVHVFSESAESATELMDGVLAEARARGLHTEAKILQTPCDQVATTLACAARAWDAELVIAPGTTTT